MENEEASKQQTEGKGKGYDTIFMVLSDDQHPPDKESRRYLTPDTNVWLHRLAWVHQFKEESNRNYIFMPQKVSHELTGLKRSDNDVIRSKAIEATGYILKWVKEDKIMVQDNEDFKLSNKDFSTKQLSDNNIVESVLILKRRGVDIAMSTMDDGMKILCHGNGIELFDPRDKANQNFSS